MSADVDLDLDDLQETVTALRVVVDDFTTIASTVDGVRSAIGTPHGRGALRDRVGDFESGWNGNREVIQENLQGVLDHLQGLIDGFRETDAALAATGE